MKIISTSKAPAAIGPYSQAIVSGNLVYASGQIPINPATGLVEAIDIVGQSQQVMSNIGALLAASGSDFSRVIKTTCFLTTMDNFAVFNDIYSQHFIENPARSCVAVVALPKGVLVEVEFTAEVG